jgi:hypothetical protein
MKNGGGLVADVVRHPQTSAFALVFILIWKLTNPDNPIFKLDKEPII